MKKKAFKDSIPVMLGYLFVGIAFGLLFKEKGYSVFWAVAMSVFVYAGSMQFIGINFFVPGVNYLEVLLMTLLVNIRHIFYGLSMIEKFKKAGKRKQYLIFALTDETYSLLCNHEENDPEYMFYLSLFNQLYWIAGTVLGSLMSDVLPFNSKGIDFAMSALFIVIFLDQWMNSTKHESSLLGIFSACIALLLFGSDGMVIPAMILIVLGSIIFRKRIEVNHHE